MVKEKEEKDVGVIDKMKQFTPVQYFLFLTNERTK